LPQKFSALSHNIKDSFWKVESPYMKIEEPLDLTVELKSVLNRKLRVDTMKKR